MFMMRLLHPVLLLRLREQEGVSARARVHQVSRETFKCAAMCAAADSTPSPSLTLTPSLSEVNTKQSKFLFKELHDSRLLQDSPNLAGRFLPRSGPLIPSDLLSSYDPIVRLFHLNYFRAENAQKFIARASDIFRVKRLAASGWGIGEAG